MISHVGVPSSWTGRAVLVFHRTAWFVGDGSGLLGLMQIDLDPRPCGVGLSGLLPRVRVGNWLTVVNANIELEGEGSLGTLDNELRLDDAFPSRPPFVPLRWKQRWQRWFEVVLPQSGEGSWLLDRLNETHSDWSSWIGLGSGSTPLGDDVLAGWWAAQSARGSIASEAVSCLLSQLERTSALSRHYLFHLAHGRADNLVTQFLTGLVAPEPDAEVSRTIASRGHLSGIATLVGLVSGLTQGEKHAVATPLCATVLS